MQEPFEFRRVPSSYDARYRRVDASLPEQSLPDVVRSVGNGRHFFYVLVAYNRKSSKSLEAGIKYLVFGALSSSLLLLGIVLLYGVGASPEAWGASYPGYESMDPLAFQYLGNLLEENSDNLLLRTGVVLIVAGIAFKIGAAPFQIWVPTLSRFPSTYYCFFGRVLKGCWFFCPFELGERAIRRNGGISSPVTWFRGHFHHLFRQPCRLCPTES